MDALSFFIGLFLGDVSSTNTEVTQQDLPFIAKHPYLTIDVESFKVTRYPDKPMWTPTVKIKDKGGAVFVFDIPKGLSEGFAKGKKYTIFYTNTYQKGEAVKEGVFREYPLILSINEYQKFEMPEIHMHNAHKS